MKLPNSFGSVQKLSGNRRKPYRVVKTVGWDENGKQMTFEQVAVIPYEVRKEKKLYCVLKPLDKIEGIADDEAIVFLVDTDENGNTVIRIEEDEEVAIAVFDKYYDLLEEAQKEEKEKKTTAKKTTTKSTGKTAGKPAGKKETK